MPIPKEESKKNLVFDIRVATVVPGKITGENKTYELKGIDLAMKLHYLKGLYFFNNTNITTTTTNSTNNNNGTSNFWSVKEMKSVHMYDWLISYFVACGRIRASSDETGDRPSIKLNDAGIRVVEAQSNKTVDELLAMEDFLSMQDQLIYNHSLGPDLPFSPLVCLQVTWFKCGGISMGLSWAHILGDAFSATEFMNMWTQYMQGHHQNPKTLAIQHPSQPKYKPLSPTQEPTSVKRVNPVGDHWVNPTNCKIGTHTFHLTPQQLDQLHLKVHGSKMNDKDSSQCFEVITAIIWKSIAKIRNDLETKNVTICRPKTIKKEHGMPYNGQVLGTVEAKFSVSSADPLTLVHLIAENYVDEGNMVEELVNHDVSKFDYIVYGTNLTFVDMEQVDIYGFEIKGKRPTFACYTIDGVGDKGSILVLPGTKDGKLVVLHLDENEIESFKHELNKEWCIA
ncbi:protein ECERIFERUM 26-like [Chenopodium quinoa]|nr:protein ECERIFERUM 26-like [Chenopodium quinoa]